MGKLRPLIGSAGLLVATTLGVGVFSLPYIFSKAGWGIGLLYLVVLAGVVIWSHSLYSRILDLDQGTGHLLGLARRHLGRGGYALAFVAILAGLVLALVAYLVIGAQFTRFTFPALTPGLALFVFWLFCVFPLVMGLRWLVGLEFFGALLMGAIILFVFVSGAPLALFARAPVVDLEHIFLPFGAILFSLAGWTAVEPMHEYERKSGLRGKLLLSLTLGTGAATLLSALFVLGIVGSVGTVTEDTVSGLAAWPLWKQGLLSLFGLFAIWTSYVPIGLEIKNSLTESALLRGAGFFLAVFLPLALVLSGFDSFLRVIGLAGGAFLSVQYLLIFMLGKKLLPLARGARWGVNAVMFLFLLAAMYEVYYFVIG